MRPYMPEAEARTKHCPPGRTLFTYLYGKDVALAGVNRWGEKEAGKTRCLGSDCMWWGWKGGIVPNQGVNGLGRCTGGC